MKIFRLPFLTLFLLLGLGLTLSGNRAFSQNITATITGTITDPSGAVVVGARIVARNTATNIEFPTRTNKDGVYNLVSIPTGPYMLTVSAPGYRRASVAKFDLESDQVARYDIPLAIGASTDTVTVTALAPILNTQDATLGTTLTDKEITNLPLVSDNVMTLGLLTPGAIQPTPAGFDNISHPSGFANPSFNVNGNREQANNFTLDGLDINDAIDNWMAYTPSRNSLQEYQMITGNNTAEYGNANGGQVVMTTKSGTNQFHGESFFQFQNTLMNANTWAQKHTATLTPRQPLNRAYFGGTLGGPIYRDKLFFFIDYRGVRQHQTAASFSTQPDPAYQGVASNDMTGQAALKGTGTAYDPTLGKAVPITNPAAIFVLSHPQLYPVCNQYAPGQAVGTGCVKNSSGANYEGFTSTGTDINQGDVKLDWRASGRDLVSGRYTQVANQANTSRIPMPVDTPVTGTYPYHGFVVNWVHTISSNLVNEGRIGYSRTRYTNYPVDITGLIGTSGLADIGVPGPTQVFPGIASITFAGTGPAVGNFGPTGGGKATDGVVNAFTYGDKLEWQLGRSSLKFGAQAIRYQENRYYSGNTGPLGTWTFTGSTTNAALSTGSSYADFLEDKASAFAVGSSTGRWGDRQWRPAIFFQDDYKLRPDLTVNLGIRWEYDQPMYEANNKQSNINAYTGAITFAGVDGASRALYNSYWGGFMPRVGFAYAPEQFHNRFVVRGGYAITNFMEGLGANQRLVLNPFFVYSASATATTTPLQMTSGYPTLTAITPSTIAGNLIGWDPHIKPALVQQFDMILAYQLTNSLGVQIGYVGQVGHHLADLIGLNQAPCSIIAVTTGGTPCNSPLATIVPALATHNIQYTESEGVMNYNALQTTVQQHAGHNVDFIANYTFSKSMSDSPGYYGSSGVLGAGNAYPQDSTHLAGDYGPSYFNAKHIVSFAVIYQLPIGRGQLIGHNFNRLEDALLGGWKASFLGTWHSGFPQTIFSTTYYKVNGVSSGPIRANQYRALKIVNRSFAHWLGTDPSAEGEASLVTTSEVCGGKTISVYTGTTGSTGVSGRTGSSNATVPGTTTGTCPTNPNHISLNPSAVYSSVASPANATMKQAASTNTIYTSNDNGVSAYGEELSTGFGTSSYGSTVTDPGYHNFDASAAKDFAMPRGFVLGFRADAYNVLNGVSWAPMNDSISNSSFGSINSSGTSTTERHLQLALHLTF